MNRTSEHTFHIPVMGIAFTLDTPVKVARYGINSVVSIVEDRIIETMRKHYYHALEQEYHQISTHEPDYRAKRITDYLNLLDTIVERQMEAMRSEPFEQGTDILKYFELLPASSTLKKQYYEMLRTTDVKEKVQKQDALRQALKAGRIDVNIMTKVDREQRTKDGEIVPDGSDAVAALRGYMQSNLTNSSIVFSAGMNPRLFTYLESSSAFDPNEHFEFNKKVIIKVSDFRSALIQGKFLAKKGIWVSEFRIESGLNCGGHAFATDGILLGPILEEFKTKRKELTDSMFEIYKLSIEKKLGFTLTKYPEVVITVQGGIGTASEDEFLRTNYAIASTGWGTPFLLVPEATTVDEHTLQLLKDATETDVVLSNNSPLGVRFQYLKGTTSAHEKQQRIDAGKFGSPCTEKHLALNTEFTEEPICTASRKYQKLKLKHLQDQHLPDLEYDKLQNEVLAKECLCVGLSNSAALAYDEPFLKHLTAVTICPGPNIANFSEIVSLQTMVDHIYGRTNIMTNNQRLHVFIAEMNLYITYFKEQIIKEQIPVRDTKRKVYFQAFLRNLSEAIVYYRRLVEMSILKSAEFDAELSKAEDEVFFIKHEYLLD
ncbi:MAG: hypothetical protein IPM69_04180 [Ignavibacteria bacterium]|nr:hypothetical protein [Ignavibacteria bacterium]